MAIKKCKYPESTKTLARRHRAEGVSYREIAKILGMGRDTIRMWCDDHAQKRRNTFMKLYMAKQVSRYNTNEEYRITTLLTTAASHARKRGHSPVKASVAQIMGAYKDQQASCAICGIQESKTGRRLYIDHDHETGCFRGLLCMGCNSHLSILDNHKTKVFAYLGWDQ